MLKKLIFVFGLLLIFSFDSYAQRDSTQNSNLDSILGRIKGDSVGETSKGGAPTSPSSKPSNIATSKGSESDTNFDLFSKLIYPSLYLVRQEYKVVANGSAIGKDEKPYWGYGLGIGVQVGDQTLLPSHLYRPWEFDQSYTEVKMKYPEAVSSQTKLMSVSDKKYQNTDPIQWQEGAALSYINNGGKTTKGLESDTGESGGEYFFVLISVNNQDSDAPAIFQTTRGIKDISLSNGTMILENYSVPDQTIGGVLFHKIETPGTLSVKVAGIGSMVSNDMVIHRAKGATMNNDSNTNEEKPSRKRGKKKKKKEKKEEVKKEKKKRTRGRSGRRGG